MSMKTHPTAGVLNSGLDRRSKGRTSLKCAHWTDHPLNHSQICQRSSVHIAVSNHSYFMLVFCLFVCLFFTNTKIYSVKVVSGQDG